MVGYCESSQRGLPKGTFTICVHFFVHNENMKGQKQIWQKLSGVRILPGPEENEMEVIIFSAHCRSFNCLNAPHNFEEKLKVPGQ